jgi:Protein of unknown function (DUF3131)
MTFKSGLLHARSSIVFLLALGLCFALVIMLDAGKPATRPAASPWPEISPGIPKTLHRDLTPQEANWARIAWRYFERNYQPSTGLVNSVDQYPASTMWDTGSYLLALISAERLSIITRKDFDVRMGKALDSLARLPLFDGVLPNKSYNVITLKLVDYNNNESSRGIGWSAIDLGRLFVPFQILIWHYPEHSEAVKKIIRSWKLENAVDRGQLFGAVVDKTGRTVRVQEGRLGYEQYSAKSFSLIGMDVTVAMNYTNFLQYVPIYGIEIPTDARRPEEYHALNYVVSEPYILDGVEYGWDTTSREYSYRVYEAQAQRYARSHTLSAVSEDNLDRPPYFVYNTVYTNGKAWNTVTETGDDASKFKSLSTKAAFGWYALYDDPYTAQLINRAGTLNDPAKGWYAGEYEILGEANRALTANTNAIVLETLCYRQFRNMLDVR